MLMNFKEMSEMKIKKIIRKYPFNVYIIFKIMKLAKNL